MTLNFGTTQLSETNSVNKKKTNQTENGFGGTWYRLMSQTSIDNPNHTQNTIQNLSEICPDPPPLKNRKHIGFLSNTGLDPLKKQASIQCLDIIGPPAKRHFNGVLLAC